MKASGKITKVDDGFERLDFGMIMHKNCHVIVLLAWDWVPKFINAFNCLPAQARLMFDKRNKKHYELKLPTDLLELWLEFEKIWNALLYKQDKIDEISKNNFVVEEHLFSNFGKLYSKNFSSRGSKSIYLHIVLCHTIQVSIVNNELWKSINCCIILLITVLERIRYFMSLQ